MFVSVYAFAKPLGSHLLKVCNHLHGQTIGITLIPLISICVLCSHIVKGSQNFSTDF